MLDHKRSPDLPTFAALRQLDLGRITGHPGTRLLRLRYQPEARAILHVALGAGADAPEGSIWFYAGRKAETLAAKLPEARFDPATGALFQAFPQDHRLPALAAFVQSPDTHAIDLIGGPPLSAPVPVRYRPGLSATFHWTRTDGAVFFVKHTTETEVTTQAQTLRNLTDAARGRDLGFPEVSGMVPRLGLIAHAAAPGVPLSEAPCDRDVAQVLAALQTLWSLSVVPDRMLDRPSLLALADRSRRMIGLLDDAAGQAAAGVVTRLRNWRVPVRMRPIHGDMKPEHALLSGRRTCLVDMDSLALGDPDYDLAALEARITLARLRDRIAAPVAESAMHLIRQLSGPGYPWFLTCARLTCASHLAARPDPESLPLIHRMLGDP